MNENVNNGQKGMLARLDKIEREVESNRNGVEGNGKRIEELKSSIGEDVLVRF